MNKAKLIEKVSERMHTTYKTAKVVVDTIFDSMRGQEHFSRLRKSK